MWRWPWGLPIAGIYSKDCANNTDSCILKIVFPKGHRKREDPHVQIRPISSFHWIWRRPTVLLHSLCGTLWRRADPLFLRGRILGIHSLSSQPAPGKSGSDETTTPRTMWETELPEMAHCPPDSVQGHHRPEAVYSQRHGNLSVLLLKAIPSSSNTQSTFN